jgi:flavorubredoxin
MGGSYELDGRLTWAPADPGRFHPLNCFLLKEEDELMLVDPGPVWHEDLIIEQLLSVVPAGSAVSVFLSRAEFDAFQSLGSLAETFKISRLISGGGNNPFDAFENLANADPAHRSAHLRMMRTPSGYSIPVKGERSLEILRPPLRLSAVFWAYDGVAKTLFCSDSFGHGTMSGPGENRVITDVGGFDLKTVRSHVCAKHWWLPHARGNAAIVTAELREIFEGREINTLAPNHGCVIHGRETVLYHYGLVQQVLSAIAAEDRR